MLDAIQRKMGIDDDEASELADLEMENRPEDVLAEIERLQRAISEKHHEARPTVDQGPMTRIPAL